MLTTPDSTIARHISEVAGIDSDILFGIDDFVLSSLFRTSENNENVLLFIQNGETVVHKVSLPANMISSSQNKTDILAAVRRMTSSRFMEYLPAHGS